MVNVLESSESQQNFTVPRQARWASLLSQYNLVIQFIPGKDNIVADALTRQWDDSQADTIQDLKLLADTLNEDNIFFSKLGTREQYRIPKQDIASSLGQNFVLAVQNATLPAPKLTQFDVRQQWHNGYLDDTQLGAIYRHLKEGTAVIGAKKLHKKFTLSGGLLFYGEKIIVPFSLRQGLLSSAHAVPMHLGPQKMLERLTLFWWEGMVTEIRVYCQYCLGCMRGKGSKLSLGGVAEALTPATRPFQRLHFDLVGKMKDAELASKKVNMVFTCIDSFSKFAWAIPCEETVTAKDIATLFMTHIMPYTGIPRSWSRTEVPNFRQFF